MILSSLLCLGALVPFTSPAMTAENLRCDWQVDPVGIDGAHPRLSWTLRSEERGERQTAYRILVASRLDLLTEGKADLWDSREVRSDATVGIAYAGRALASSQKVFWKVRAQDANGHSSSWSAAATWSSGILSPGDWKAKWITAAPVAHVQGRPLRGYHALETRQEDDVKWVQVDLGQARPIDSIRLQPMHHWGVAGFGFPLRYRVEVSDQPTFDRSQTVADFTKADVPSPENQPVTLRSPHVRARYVRIIVTKLWKRDWAYCFALSQLQVFSGTENVAEHAPVVGKDSVEQDGWGATALTDGIGEAAGRFETMRLRRDFNVSRKLRQAIVHVCGLGQYEMTLNGRKVGNDLLTPGWTNYRKTCLYDSYDVTKLLRSGDNSVGLLLGNGMYNVHGGRYTKFTGSFGPLRAIAQLDLEFEDGTHESLGTDGGWRASPGPIAFSCVYGGEDYDTRLDTPAGAAWGPAAVVESPGGTLRGASHSAPAIRTHDVLHPVRVRQIRPGVEVYDLGQNASLMPRLSLEGPAGSKVKIIPAELLAPDGTVDRTSVGGGPCYWQITLDGTSHKAWFPKFFYHGSRYLQVERTSPEGKGLPLVKDLVGVVVHTSAEPVGSFECSSDLFNRIHSLIRWAQRSNLVSVITDCPHRERLGWLEQYHLNGPALRYEFDLTRLFAKGMGDMADSQLENGLVPDIAPEYVQFQGGFRDSPEWGSAYVLVPWQQYLWTGDLTLLREHYEGMKRYVAYLGAKSKNLIVSHGLGDWYDIGPRGPGTAQLTPIALTATAFYYEDTATLAKVAERLGEKSDAEQFRTHASAIRSAFNQAFYNPAKGYYSTGSQTANSIALAMELADPANRGSVLKQIVADVHAHGDAITSGDVGYRYLLRALAEGGRSDVIFTMNNQSDKPGYGYQLRHGATSLTEAWDTNPSSSQNHFMLGQIMEWFYHDLAGIAPTAEAPGFKKVIFHPAFVGDLKWVRASHQTVYGKVSSAWLQNGTERNLEVTLPPNTTGEVHLPVADATRVKEGKTTAGKAKGVRLLRTINGESIFAIESGTYRFAFPR